MANSVDPYDVGLLPHSLLVYFTTNESDETNRVMDHIDEWCRDHAQGMWYKRSNYSLGKYYQWYFQIKADAMLFKLVFGGNYAHN